MSGEGFVFKTVKKKGTFTFKSERAAHAIEEMLKSERLIHQENEEASLAWQSKWVCTENNAQYISMALDVRLKIGGIHTPRS